MTPYARKRLQQREHRTPRRLRPQPGPERPQPMMIAATIPDELAARVPGDSARSRRFSTARPQSSFRGGEEFRRWTADARWSRGGPRSGPPSALRDAHPMSRRDHTGPREGKRRAEKPATCFRFDLGLARFRSVASVAHRVFASQDSGNGHQLRDSSRRLLTPRKSGPTIITHSS